LLYGLDPLGCSGCDDETEPAERLSLIAYSIISSAPTERGESRVLDLLGNQASAEADEHQTHALVKPAGDAGIFSQSLTYMR